MVRQQLKDKDPNLLLKIKKRSNEYGVPEEKIIKEIKNCDTAVMSFVKEPSKQNFYENLAFDMISKMRGLLI